jgi:pyridinium-3,5-bisthiocarboxylic acid mononucleotide nickel chelatase
MRILYLDCFSGISGDMTVGALCDLGVKPSTFEWELSKLQIGEFHMHFERAQRKNIEGVRFNIHSGATHAGEEAAGHEHAHEHGTHAHEGHSHEHAPADDEHHHHDEHDHEDHDQAHAHGRNHREIRALIEASDLSLFVKRHALGIFQRIAQAEGKIHGMPAAEVHFHEVGALDSIADIISACAGLESLGVEKVFVSSLHDGHGWIDCAHGRFPIPAPATLEILTGIALGQIDEPHELVTPTGAAIVAEFGVAFGRMPVMRVEKIGYGVGSRDLASRPNVLRAVLGELVEE